MDLEQMDARGTFEKMRAGFNTPRMDMANLLGKMIARGQTQSAEMLRSASNLKWLPGEHFGDHFGDHFA